MEQSDCRILPDCIVYDSLQQFDWSILIGPLCVDPYLYNQIFKAMQVYRVVGDALG